MANAIMMAPANTKRIIMAAVLKKRDMPNRDMVETKISRVENTATLLLKLEA